MSLIEGKHMKPWSLMPPPKGVCQECAVDHKKEQPHDAQSMAYQYYFYNEYGKWPNWKDAMSHCEDSIKILFTKHLVAKGVDVEGGKLRPSKKKG